MAYQASLVLKRLFHLMPYILDWGSGQWDTEREEAIGLRKTLLV